MYFLHLNGGEKMERNALWFRGRIKSFNCPCLFALPELHKAVNKGENISSEEMTVFLEELFREKPDESWFYQTDDCWNSVNGFIRKWMIKQPNNNFYPVFVKLIKEIEPIIGSKETLKIILSFPFKNKELAEKELVISLISFFSKT